MTLVEYDEAHLIDCTSGVGEERQAALGCHDLDALELGSDDEGREVAIRGDVHAAESLGKSIFQVVPELVDKR
jgi:hypothetical protein